MKLIKRIYSSQSKLRIYWKRRPIFVLWSLSMPEMSAVYVCFMSFLFLMHIIRSYNQYKQVRITITSFKFPSMSPGVKSHVKKGFCPVCDDSNKSYWSVLSCGTVYSILLHELGSQRANNWNQPIRLLRCRSNICLYKNLSLPFFLSPPIFGSYFSTKTPFKCSVRISFILNPVYFSIELAKIEATIILSVIFFYT